MKDWSINILLYLDCFLSYSAVRIETYQNPKNFLLKTKEQTRKEIIL